MQEEGSNRFEFGKDDEYPYQSTMTVDMVFVNTRWICDKDK